MNANRDHTQSVLFVCMGNICRSPTAEGVLRVLHRKLAPGLQLTIDSAGTHAYYHLGEQPDPRSQRAAIGRGYDISAHRARMVTPEDFRTFDYVLAMDSENLRHLEQMRSASSGADLRLLLDFANEQTLRSVPDPYSGGVEGFERVLDLVEQGVLGLLRHMCSDQGVALNDVMPAQKNTRR